MLGDLKFLANLKQQNPALKVLVSLRPSEKNFTFEPNTTTVSQSANTVGSRVRRNGQNSASAIRTRFAKRMKEFLARHNIDGVDLDWEFFRETDKKASSKELLVSVVRTLRTTFSPTQRPTSFSSSSIVNENNMLITLTTSKFPRELTDNYDFAELQKYIDFVNVPAFGFDSIGKSVKHPARLHGISDMENAVSRTHEVHHIF